MKNPDKTTPDSGSVLLVLALLLAGIGLMGFFYISGQYREFDAELHLRLNQAAEMKAAQVSAWLEERAADSQVLAAGAVVIPELQRVLSGVSSPGEQQRVASWLVFVLQKYHYSNVILTSRTGEVLLSAVPIRGSAEHYQSDTTEALAAAAPVLDDLNERWNAGHPHLGVNFAVRSPKGVPSGVLLLEIDPDVFLYPVLRDWPGAGHTGELLLVKRDGDSVVNLNDTRLQPGSTLNIRRPLTFTTMPAVRAVLGGTDRIDGMDYRGARVVAAARPVPGSPWFVVAKMDRDEAFSGQNRNSSQLIALLITLLLVTGALVGMLLRRQSARFYREQYQMEMQRRTLLEQYELLSRHASDAILVWGRDGKILEVNERATRMFGYSREEMLGLSMLDLKPEEAAADFHHIVKRLAEEQSAIFETVNRRKDGTTFPTEVSASLIDLEERQITQSIVRDISARKQAEQQIKHLNHLYAVLSQCDAAIVRAASEEALFQEVCRIVVDAGGFRVGWVGKVDPATGQVLPVARAGEGAGYLDEIRIMTGAGPLGLGPTGRCIREGRAIASTSFATDPVMEPWREAAARHGLRSSICLPLSRRGETVFVLGMYSSETAFFSAEEIKLAVEVGESLSFALDRMDLERAREIAERERRISEERLELALDAANEGYWDWKVETGECYFSPRFSTMIGYQPGELNFSPEFLLELVHPEDRAVLQEVRDLLVQGTEGSPSTEFRVCCKDGHYIWVLGTVKVVARNALGRPLRVIGTRVDITDRKHLQQQFLQAQKMETIGRLAGGIAHDFNNHLTVINGYSGLLQSQLPADSPIRGPLATIHDAGERAAALTRQLLAFSRKQIERKEALDPNVAIAGMQKLIANLMGENVELRLGLAPDAGWVLADATRIEQVVMNLTVNARDAIKQHGTVTVKTARVVASATKAHPGPHVRISVIDNGSGMTPEVQLHIFEPFFTTKDKFRGTGLGLATVYGIVEGCDGFIEVESEPGKGSSFHVYLPCLPPEIAQVAPQKQPVPEKGGSETILLVEDDDNVREIGTDILKHYGYRVLAAADGFAAIALAAAQETIIDLVISDVMMPGMNGTEMVQQLLRVRPDMKVLFVSGHTDDSIHLAELTGAGAHFLPKPYRPVALAAKVRELLSTTAPGPGEVK